MKDTTTMTLEEKDAYIFAEGQSEMFPNGRFHWISDCMLGDIRTFLDGIEHYVQHKADLTDRGGGNLSVPILISTAVEFISALYVGKTEYKDGNQYDATENVKQFVIRFWPEHYKKFPRLIWDGTRNGIVHLFSPKPFEYQCQTIRFQFFVEPKTCPSHVTRQYKNATVFIRINVFELYDVLKKAVDDYRDDLKTSEERRDKFISAWESIENHLRNIDSDSLKSNEAKVLLSELTAANNSLILRKGRTINITDNLGNKPRSDGKGQGQTTKADSIANISPPINGWDV